MELNQNYLKEIFQNFNTKSEFVKANKLTFGHINKTYLVSTNNERFVLQQINSFVFKNAKQLIINKAKVSQHIIKKLAHLTEKARNKKVLRFIESVRGKPYVKDDSGNYWNLTNYIENSFSFLKVNNKKMAFEGGKLISHFLSYMSDFDTNQIKDIIPDFHNIKFRLQQFEEAKLNACSQRLLKASKEIEFVERMKNEVCIIQNLIENEEIPLQITHNDTKISNMLFDENNNGMCLIDTDTVMKGSILFDLGDAARTFCSTADEDEVDLSKVQFNIKYFEALLSGFFSDSTNSISKLEADHIPLAVKTITFMMGLRMLTDYLNNDVYYNTNYKHHNLDRARNQFKLVSEIEQQLEHLKMITQKSIKI